MHLMNRKTYKNREEAEIREGFQEEAKIKRKDKWDSDQ